MKKPIMYNCANCKIILISEPSIKTENGEHYIDLYCENCNKIDPLNMLLVKKVDSLYDIQEAMEENVRIGYMDKRWDEKKQDWTYGLTNKGRKYVENRL